MANTFNMVLSMARLTNGVRLDRNAIHQRKTKN